VRRAQPLDQSRLTQLVDSVTPRSLNGAGLKISDIVVQPAEALLSSIDTILTVVLSAKVREAVYDNLARQRALAREDIPSHMGEFIILLEKTFGVGAATLQRRIIKLLYQTMGWEEIKVTNFGLAEHYALISAIVDRVQSISKSPLSSQVVAK
jgi:hypothetical protein